MLSKEQFDIFALTTVGTCRAECPREGRMHNG